MNRILNGWNTNKIVRAKTLIIDKSTFVRTNHKIQKHRNQYKNRSNNQTTAANYRSLTSNAHLNNHAFRGF